MSGVERHAPMDKLVELEDRIKEYRQHCMNAEKTAVEKLKGYPRQTALSPIEVLRRELLRHHTRVLLLDEIAQWIEEIKGIRLYQLYSLANADQQEMPIGQVRQHLSQEEADEVNATYEANNERLRWKPIDPFTDDEK
jgi:hypothetical protein